MILNVIDFFSGLLQMQEEIITLRKDFTLKDSQIQGFIRRIRDLRTDILDENEEVKYQFICVLVSQT